MVGKRVVSVRQEEFHQLAALLQGEAGADADVLQPAGVIEEAQQQ
jgi:hypothetical protein